MRLTEMIDYLTRDEMPTRDTYSHFDPNEQTKELRKEFRAQKEPEKPPPDLFTDTEGR